MESTNFDTGKTSSCWEKSREIELWVSIVSLDGCLFMQEARSNKPVKM